MDEVKSCESSLVTSDVVYGSKRIRLVHVRKPGSLSLKKAQCDLWEYVWGCSLVLCNVLINLDFRGIATLELGCGSGLCSLVCAQAGAQAVATDLVADALKLVVKSARLNNIHVPPAGPTEPASGVEKLDCFLDRRAAQGGVGDVGPPQLQVATFSWFSECPSNAFDMVVCSDVLFFRGAAKPVAKALAKALRPGGVALLVDPCRLNVDDFVGYLEDEQEVASVQVRRFSDESNLVDHANAMADNVKAFVQVKKTKLVIVKKCGLGPEASVSPENCLRIEKILSALQSATEAYDEDAEAT